MKKLAIIGASYLQLPLVIRAKEMGIEVHCFAWQKGAVCKEYCDFFYPISIIEKDEILKVCEIIKIDGITSIASDAAVPTISYVADKMGLIGNDYTVALNSTNKYLMRQKFTSFGVRSPLYSNTIENIDEGDLKFPVIVKPTDRSGSRGVQIINRIEDLVKAVEIAKKESFSNQVIVEEYIDGKEVSVEAVSWCGKHHILAITDKVTTGKPYFVEIEHHQPSQLSNEIQSIIIKETLKALDALQIKYGASHSEFKITKAGLVYAIEVGARMGGDFIGSSLVKLSTGFDFVKSVIEIALGHFEVPLFNVKKCSGVYFLCNETKNILSIIKNSSEHKEIVDFEIYDEQLHNVKSSMNRSGYLIYQSEKQFKI